MSVKIRKSRFTDVLSICRCNKAVLPISYSISEYISFMMDKSILLYVAEDLDQNIIGYILSQYDKKFTHILSIGVYEKYQRLGIGTMLINFLESNVNNLTDNLSLNVHVENIKAIKFYEKIGFSKKETLENYYSGNLKNVKSQSAYRFEKKL